MKQVIATPEAFSAIGPYSQGILVDGTLYVSGQLPIDPATGIMPEGVAAQTARSLRNVIAIVEAAGMTAADVVKTTVLIKSIDDFSQVNEVYATFFTGACPARICYEVANLPRGALVEVEAVAMK